MKNTDFDKLYTSYYRRAFCFAKSYTHDDLAAEDLAAEALFSYWKMLSSGKASPSDALFLTILKNKSLDYLRHEMVRQSALDTLQETGLRDLEIRISTLEACDPDELFSAEVRTILQTTLQKLPEQTRIIFQLSRIENKSVKEIAETTGLTVKGVEYHLTKALKIMRIALKDYLPLWFFLPI